MTAKLTERAMKTQLIIAVGIVAAIIVIGIASQSAFAIKTSKSFQQGYDAGFAAGKKDRLNGNEFDSKPPMGMERTTDIGTTGSLPSTNTSIRSSSSSVFGIKP